MEHKRKRYKGKTFTNFGCNFKVVLNVKTKEYSVFNDSEKVWTIIKKINYHS
jgi:hypothetical protein